MPFHSRTFTPYPSFPSLFSPHSLWDPRTFTLPPPLPPLLRICSLCFSVFISSIIVLGFHCTLACPPHWVVFGYPPGFLVYSLIVLFNSFKYQEEIVNKFSKKKIDKKRKSKILKFSNLFLFCVLKTKFFSFVAVGEINWLYQLS